MRLSTGVSMGGSVAVWGDWTGIGTMWVFSRWSAWVFWWVFWWVVRQAWLRYNGNLPYLIHFLGKITFLHPHHQKSFPVTLVWHWESPEPVRARAFACGPPPPPHPFQAGAWATRIRKWVFTVGSCIMTQVLFSFVPLCTIKYKTKICKLYVQIFKSKREEKYYNYKKKCLRRDTNKPEVDTGSWRMCFHCYFKRTINPCIFECILQPGTTHDVAHFFHTWWRLLLDVWLFFFSVVVVVTLFCFTLHFSILLLLRMLLRTDITLPLNQRNHNNKVLSELCTYIQWSLCTWWPPYTHWPLVVVIVYRWIILFLFVFIAAEGETRGGQQDEERTDGQRPHHSSQTGRYN